MVLSVMMVRMAGIPGLLAGWFHGYPDHRLGGGVFEAEIYRVKVTALPARAWDIPEIQGYRQVPEDLFSSLHFRAGGLAVRAVLPALPDPCPALITGNHAPSIADREVRVMRERVSGSRLLPSAGR